MQTLEKGHARLSDANAEDAASQPRQPDGFLVVCRHLIHFPSPRANSIQVIHTLHALARAGAEVWFYPQRYTEPTPERCLASYGLSPHPRLVLRRSPRFTRGLRRHRGLLYDAWEEWRFGRQRRRRLLFLLREGVDSYEYALRLAPKARRWGARILLEAHRIHAVELAESEGEPHPWLARLARLEPAGIQAADGIVSISQTLARGLARHYGRTPPIRVLRSGFVAPDGDDPPLSERRGIVYAGQLLAWKGVDGLLQAMQHLPDERLTLVGGHSTDELRETQRRAGELGVSDRVDFVGHKPHAEVRKWLVAARCAVVPLGTHVLARSFTSPLKIFEYLSAGTPIVATSLDTTREILRHEETALLVPPGDPAAMARAIGRVLGDDALAERLRSQGRREVARYTWDARAAGILAFAESLHGS